MFAGLSTGKRMLENWVIDSEEDDDDESQDNEAAGYVNAQDSPFKNLTKEEISCLERFVKILEEHQEKDPKYDLLKRVLTENHIIHPWIDLGCIVFSQYYDTIKWMCDHFAKEHPHITFGLYAGSDKSVWV